MQFYFYSTAAWHLCDQALVLIERLIAQGELVKSQVEYIDISEDENLVDLYGVRIPVLKNKQNAEELGWPFDLDTLRLFIS